MEARISIVTLGVMDVGRSRAFYEALGFKASGASLPQIAFFQLGGIALALFGREALAEDAQIESGPSAPGAIALAQNVMTPELVDTTLKAGEAAGGRLLKAGHKTPWGGYSGYFADPDGHPWEIAWNPHFELREDGSLRLPD